MKQVIKEAMGDCSTIGSRQHPLPAEKKTLSGKPYLYNKENNR